MSDYDLYCSSWEMGVHLFFVNESLNHFHELQRNIISGRYSPGDIKKTSVQGGGSVRSQKTCTCSFCLMFIYPAIWKDAGARFFATQMSRENDHPRPAPNRSPNITAFWTLHRMARQSGRSAKSTSWM